MNSTIVSVVTKVTDKCNLGCSYCHIGGSRQKSISYPTLRSLLEPLLQVRSDYIHLNWSGGEPLLLPDSLFEFIKLERQKYKPSFDDSIQTNGLLLTAERFENLTAMGFKLGVSFDGTTDLQCKQRLVNLNVAERIYQNLLERNKSLNNVIAVLTKYSIGKEKEIYENLRRVSNNASVNMYIPTGRGKNYATQLLPTPEDMGKMLIHFYGLWSKDDSKFMLSPFVRIVQSLFNPKANHICEYSAEVCNKVIGVDPEGGVYFCARATSNPEFFMGNLNHQSLDDILSHPIRDKIFERRELLRKKCNCEYFDICNGGCPEETLVNGNFFDKTYYCESRRMLFDHIVKDLKNG